MDYSWRNNAACKEADTDLFFGTFEESSLNERLEIASICANCTVSNECRAYATSIKNINGFWAGEYYENGKPRNLVKLRKRNKDYMKEMANKITYQGVVI